MLHPPSYGLRNRRLSFAMFRYGLHFLNRGLAPERMRLGGVVIRAAEPA